MGSLGYYGDLLFYEALNLIKFSALPLHSIESSLCSLPIFPEISLILSGCFIRVHFIENSKSHILSIKITTDWRFFEKSSNIKSAGSFWFITFLFPRLVVFSIGEWWRTERDWLGALHLRLISACWPRCRTAFSSLPQLLTLLRGAVAPIP